MLVQKATGQGHIAYLKDEFLQIIDEKMKEIHFWELRDKVRLEFSKSFTKQLFDDTNIPPKQLALSQFLMEANTIRVVGGSCMSERCQVSERVV